MQAPVRVLVLCVLGFLLAVPGPAAAAAAAGVEDPADQWLPRSDGAYWVYRWSNSDYSPAPRTERYELQARSGTAFRISWQEVNPPAAEAPTAGQMDFRHTDAGLVNTNYQSTQPPAQFPVLCASASECGNSVVGALYLLVWGTRSPVLAEPLLRDTRWNSTGGAANDVASANRYLGREKVVVPAFPRGIDSAEVESDVSQAGALGDPFGSGVRTVHWVRGVGPARIVFRHAGGATSTAELVQTNLTPRPLPAEDNLLPLNRGDSAVFRWRNDRHMRTWSRQQVDVSEVVNNTARVDVKSLSGPIKVSGSYTFATRLGGVTHISAFTRAATRVKFPALGPQRAAREQRRRLHTPVDFLVFGLNPVAPVYAVKGQSWRSSRESRDWRIFGVVGRAEVLGKRRMRTPAGTFLATGVRSELRQSGFRFGSGTRTAWFAPGKGLVRLVFRHADGSVSTVERLR